MPKETKLQIIKENLAVTREHLGEEISENEELSTWVAIFYGSLYDLVKLKDIKDSEGKTPEYRELQPKAWHKARMAIELWEKSDFGSIPLKEVNTWIKVKEQEPLINQPVSFVVSKDPDFNGQVFGGWYVGRDKDHFKFACPGICFFAELWQPFPAPPKTAR